MLLSNDLWQVKDAGKKGKGIFAKKDIEPGTIIGDYIGKVIKTAEEDIYEDKEHFYLMYYHDRASIYPDLKKPGIHLLNHSCTPNCWMYTYKGHTLYFAIRRIFKGEELTVSYLLSPQDKDCNPCDHLCACKSSVCYGTMHLSDERYDKWIKVHDAQEKKTKPGRITYGKELPKLSSYPKEIADHDVYNLFGSSQKPAKQLGDTVLPSKKQLRKLIRESGRILKFPKVNTTVYGIVDDLIISG